MKDRKVVVVGGGTGIGAAIAEAAARLGAAVLVGGRRTEPLDELTRRCEDVAGSITGHPVDVGDDASVQAFFQHADQTLGQIDVMVNSAGTNIVDRTMAAMKPEDFATVMNVNATGAYRCLAAVLPAMRARRGGLVVQISSVAGKRALELGGVAYCASKFAMTAMGTAVANECRQEGVRITNVYPGEVNTPLLEQRPVAVTQEHRQCILQPEDVATLVVSIMQLPPRAHVPEIVIKPTIQHWM